MYRYDNDYVQNIFISKIIYYIIIYINSKYFNINNFIINFYKNKKIIILITILIIKLFKGSNYEKNCSCYF